MSSYVGRAFVHPLHWLALGGVVAVALWMASAVPVLLGVPMLEAVVLGVVPHWRTFRGRVDTDRGRRERAERERRRSDLLARMSLEHRDHVVRLERLLASLRARLGEDEQRVTAHVDVEELIDRYAVLAVLHEEALHGLYEAPVSVPSSQVADVLAAADGAPATQPAHRAEVDDEMLPIPASFGARQVSKQRLAVMSRRLAARRDNERRLAAVHEQLETIAELIKLVHERSLFAIDIADTDALIAQTAQELEVSGSMIESLLATRSVA